MLSSTSQRQPSWDDEGKDDKIDALMQAICKGGLGAVTWVEQGWKSLNKKNNTAGKCLDGSGNAEEGGDSGEKDQGDCGEKRRKRKRKAMTKVGRCSGEKKTKLIKQLYIRVEQLEKKLAILGRSNTRKPPKKMKGMNSLNLLYKPFTKRPRRLWRKKGGKK